MNAVVRAVLALLVVAMASLAVLVFVEGVPVIVYDSLYFIPLVAAPVLCLTRARTSSPTVSPGRSSASARSPGCSATSTGR